jgi:hypothetical protein
MARHFSKEMAILFDIPGKQIERNKVMPIPAIRGSSKCGP